MADEGPEVRDVGDMGHGGEINYSETRKP
jgi:hypothetical protein